MGMWSVESIGGQPPGLYLALGIESDTFISWSWTFDADGTFFSMMLQGWKEDTMRTTFSGTYHVSGDSYETRTSNALMSTAERTTVLSDKIEYQSGNVVKNRRHFESETSRFANNGIKKAIIR